MNLIKKINKLLKWAPEDILYTTSTRYSTYSSTPYTKYHYTELGEFMKKLPNFVVLKILKI